MEPISINRKNIYISSPWVSSDYENPPLDCIQMVFDLSGLALDSGNIPFPARLYSRARYAENVFIILHENLAAADEVWIMGIDKITPIMMYDIFAAEMLKKPVHVVKNPLLSADDDFYPESWDEHLTPFNDSSALGRDWLKAVKSLPNILGHDLTSLKNIAAKSMYLIFRNLYQTVYGEPWDAFEGINLDDDDDDLQVLN